MKCKWDNPVKTAPDSEGPGVPTPRRHLTRDHAPSTRSRRALRPRPRTPMVALLEWRSLLMAGRLVPLRGKQLLVTAARVVPPLGSVVALRTPNALDSGLRGQRTSWTVTAVESTPTTDGHLHHLTLTRSV